MAIARSVDRRLFFLLDRAHLKLMKQAEHYLAQNMPEDAIFVSPAQAAVLIYLGYHDQCSLSELAQGTGRNNSAITGLVGRMETARLVTRGHGTFDRRAKRVALTQKGWLAREQVMDRFRDFNARLVKGLTESEVNAVFKFLDLAVENVSP